MEQCKQKYYIVIFIIIALVGFLSLKDTVTHYINNTILNYDSVHSDKTFEGEFAACFYGKYFLVDVNGLFNRVLNKHEMNGVVKLNNGYLMTTIDYIDDETIDEYAEGINNLKEYLDEKGIEMVYVCTPYTLSKYDNQLPVGIYDYSNDNIDRFLKSLEERNINTIDYRELMHEDGINQYDMMYMTDHHWNIRGGFYAYGYLEKYIEDTLNVEIDDRISDINNYQIDVYKNWHLGSRGQRTGRWYTTVDDFELFIPQFDTSISYDGQEGSMMEMMINMGPLEKKDLTQRYTYDSVFTDAQRNYVNNKSLNDTKVLFITDSYANAVAPFITMGVREVEYYYNGNVSTLTKEYIEEYDPDIVILLYYSGTICEDSSAFRFDNFR